METEGSSSHSQAPATCPYPEPAQSSHTGTNYDTKINVTSEISEVIQYSWQIWWQLKTR